MAYLKNKELLDLYEESKNEAKVWREGYPEFERLADNEILDDLDEGLPETNDGTLAASLFKLPKRLVSSQLTGRATALDADDEWMTELANIEWENKIVPNANTMAPFHRKWKDAVRKAAIYGAVPIITLFVDKGNYKGADFVVAQPGDVTLEAGKVSDYDSDVIFWDVYYSKLQLENLIEEAKEEEKLAKEEGRESYNKWKIKELEEILKAKQQEAKDPQDTHSKMNDKQKPMGFKFCIAFQRGVKAPFYMYHKATSTTVREWENPDPTGDIPVHYLYCYQDFINPYGIGICKLAGGTQNVLDYMRQADVLSTQLGMRPPKQLKGDVDSIDEDSLVYARDANWYVGNGIVERMEMNNGVYSQLPERIGMYKISLNQMIPTGDTSVSAESGDPNYSKTPAGVKFQAASLSVDDQDFKDNLYMTFEAVAKSIINTHFANMEGSELLKLTDEQRDILAKTGVEFPVDANGNPTNELEFQWAELKATFDFEIDAEIDKTKDDEKKLEGLLKVAELRSSDPNFDQMLLQNGKKLNTGELFSEIIHLTSDNDKIVTDVEPEEVMEGEAMAQEQMAEQDPQMMEQPMEPEMPQDMSMQGPAQLPTQPPIDDEEAEIAAQLEEVMQTLGVDEGTAAAVLEANRQGFSTEEILEYLSA